MGMGTSAPSAIVHIDNQESTLSSFNISIGSDDYVLVSKNSVVMGQPDYYTDYFDPTVDYNDDGKNTYSSPYINNYDQMVASVSATTICSSTDTSSDCDYLAWLALFDSQFQDNNDDSDTTDEWSNFSSSYPNYVTIQNATSYNVYLSSSQYDIGLIVSSNVGISDSSEYSYAFDIIENPFVVQLGDSVLDFRAHDVASFNFYSTSPNWVVSRDVAMLMYGEDSDASLSFDYYSGGTYTTAMSFSEDQYIGFSESDPLTTLHVGIGDGTTDILKFESNDSTTLYMGSSGYVGIGTTVPSTNLHVDGTINAISFVNYATGGSEFNLQGVTLSSTVTYNHYYLVQNNYSNGSVFSLVDIDLELAQDFNNQFYAYSLTMATDNLQSLSDSSRTSEEVYGLYVDVSDVVADSDDGSYAYSAIFYSSNERTDADGSVIDVAVGVGVSPNYALHVSTFDTTGNMLVTGDIMVIDNAGYDSTIDEVFLGQSSTDEDYLQFSLSSFGYVSVTDNVQGVGLASINETTFLSITTQDDISVSEEIYDELVSYGLIINGQLFNETMTEDDTRTVIESKWNSVGLDDDIENISSENIISILDNFAYQHAYAMSVSFNNVESDGTLNSQYSTPIVITTGFEPILRQDLFTGRVGINLFDERGSEHYRVSPNLLSDTFVVSGDVRVGKYNEAGAQDSDSSVYLFFSGGPKIVNDIVLDSENLDYFYMGRENKLLYDDLWDSYEDDWGEDSVDETYYISQLNLVLKEDYTETELYFNIGYTDEADDSYNAVLSAASFDKTESAYSNSAATYLFTGVGIGTTEPEATFHVQDTPETMYKQRATFDTSIDYNGDGTFPTSATCSSGGDTADDCDYLSWYIGYVSSLSGLELADDIVWNNNTTSDAESLIYAYHDSDYITTYATVNITDAGSNELVVIENISTDNTAVNILGLDYSNLTSFTNAQNYVTFLVDSDTQFPESLGSIEGNEDGGVAFSSPEEDYAEYIRKKDPNEEIQAGDVVGIFGGEVSLSTQEADHVMVVSTSPIIIGNWPGEDNEHLYSLIAFLGQVPVKVVGEVNAGDYLVASDLEDGSAIARSIDDVTSDDIRKFIGVAWESFDGDGVGYVNTVIGFSHEVDMVTKKLQQLQDSLFQYKDTVDDLESTLEQQFKARESQIQQLKAAFIINGGNHHDRANVVPRNDL